MKERDKERYLKDIRRWINKIQHDSKRRDLMEEYVIDDKVFHHLAFIEGILENDIPLFFHKGLLDHFGRIVLREYPISSADARDLVDYDAVVVRMSLENPQKFLKWVEDNYDFYKYEEGYGVN